MGMSGVSSQFAESTRRPSYRRYWFSLYRRDVAGAERVVDDALRVWSPQRIYLKLFEPALNLSGTMWARGHITYRDEHFVTHHTLRFMRRVRRRSVPQETFGPLAIATGVGQESHLIGLRMVCDSLHWANWRTHWLSSNDRGVVGSVVERLRPAAVLLSIGQEHGLRHAERLVAHLRRGDFRGVIVVGGRVVNEEPSIVTKIGADLTAPNGPLLVRALRRSFPTRR
jgi:methanogenic corrinoid protein MtbC1